MYYIHVQSYPTGSPNVIPPSLERLDYKKLCSHAKQYCQKCGISEDSQEWWDSFLQDLDPEGSHRFDCVTPEWPLQALADEVRLGKDSEIPEDNEVRIIISHIITKIFLEQLFIM